MTTLNINDILKSNPDAPTNDQHALDMGRKLFPFSDERTEESFELKFSDRVVKCSCHEDENVDWCGESTYGLLEAALASTLISEKVKDVINRRIGSSKPTFEKEKTVGHFRFKWTENSTKPLNNVSEADIDATALILNESWDRYTIDFRQPKADKVDGHSIIDVEVYYMDGANGKTTSFSNVIFLNSRFVVSDDCRRKTTSAHELFHRVEYSYGYVTGTAAQTWWVEALGSWSQDYSYNAVNDYVTRVNPGLAKPHSRLLRRSYDACHYWKYFAEQLKKRSSEVMTEQQVIKEFLEAYENNGLDAKAASESVTRNRISMNFDQFFQDWAKTNYIKDLGNSDLQYGYNEDKEVTNSCSRTYGPYRKVEPVVEEVIDSNDYSFVTSMMREVEQYGTDYLHFEIGQEVTRTNFRFKGNPNGGVGRFSCHLILIKSNEYKEILDNVNGKDHTWNLVLEKAQYDRCAIAINGLATGGEYEVSVNPQTSGV